MNKLQILYIGRNEEISDTVVRVLNRGEYWEGHGVQQDHEALQYIREQSIDLVLLGAGIDEEGEQTLRRAIEDLRPGLPVVQHYGGGSGLLSNEIMEALHRSGRSLPGQP